MAEELNGNGHSMTWKMSPNIGKLFEALAKAQLKFDPVLKDSANPAYHSKYADLASVIGATQPHLAAEGLALIQMPQAEFGAEDAKILTLTTLMGHSSGEWISSDLKLPAMMRERFDAQSVGSAITYARRYSWSAMTGVAQEDDDGNSASGMGTKEAAQSALAKKLREMASCNIEAINIIPWKEGTYALTGNGLAILRSEMTADDKEKVRISWSAKDKVWYMPEADGNMLASLAEKHKLPVVWKESNA